MSREASGLKEDRKKVFKRAFFMASGTLTSRILGLLRDVALGALFDRTVTDAWTAAFRIPNLFRRLFGEGSLSVSFIPVFMEAQEADPHGIRSRNLVNGFYSLLLIVLGVLTLLGLIFTEQIFGAMLADSYVASPEKWLLTVRMGQIMFGFVFFVIFYAYFMGLLNALGSFGWPAVAPALLNISMLIFTFLPPRWFAQQGDGLAWGVLVGGVLQALLLWKILKERNYLPRWQKNFLTSDVVHVVKNMLPGLVGMGLLQFSTLVNLYFASQLPEGAISYIYWADRLLELPLSLISVSLGAALLPTLSALHVQKEKLKFKESSQESFLMNFYLAWPAALGLFFLAGPIIQALFLRGHFSMQDAEATASVLKLYAASLVALSCSRVLMPLYYAIKNVWYPALASGVALMAHIGIANHLLAEQGLLGLIWAGMIAAYFNLLLLFAGLFYFKISFVEFKFVKALAKIFVAGGGLAALLILSQDVLLQNVRGLLVGALLFTIHLGILVYFVLSAFLRCEEFTKIRPLIPLLRGSRRQKE